MNSLRAGDIVRHITQDKDYGYTMIQNLAVDEAVAVVTDVIPQCIKKAQSDKNANDEGFFKEMLERYRAVAAEKIKRSDRVWVAYSDLTGYPYILDGDLVAIYDYSAHKELEDRLNAAGYKVSFGKEDAEEFKQEIGHMYRNGYNNIRFIDMNNNQFTLTKEAMYQYDEFFDDKYIANPGLQCSMISYFQELRRNVPKEDRMDILKKLENNMFRMMLNSEFMVPCTKEENDDQVEISHPYIDLTDRVTEKKEDEKVIALPAFTDGYEMNKCYEGQYENMLYKYDELISVVDELGASGVIINCLGISFYMNKELLKNAKR